jgi:transposase InsO family protein
MDIQHSTGQKLELHTIVDQYSGACIEAQLLEKETVVKRSARVTWREAQNTLRAGFSAWDTLPESVQTDGEPSLIGRAGWDFPSDFTLWLIGLGISHSVIRSGRCTDNAEVERGHRTVNDYAIVGQEKQPICDLQLVVHQAARDLAFSLPSRAKECNGQAPVMAYPALLDAPRPYQLQQELALFDLDHVDAFLAKFQWQRSVNKNGVVQLGGQSRRYYIGRKFAYQQVQIFFDSDDRHLVFYDADDLELCRKPIRGLTEFELIGMDDPDVALVPQQLSLFPDVLKGVNC